MRVYDRPLQVKNGEYKVSLDVLEQSGDCLNVNELTEKVLEGFREEDLDVESLVGVVDAIQLRSPEGLRVRVEEGTVTYTSPDIEELKEAYTQNNPFYKALSNAVDNMYL